MESSTHPLQIRKLKEDDLEEVMSIWLTSNLDTHSYISADYWKSNFAMVREAIAEAEVYVCESNGNKKERLLGFIGIVSSEYIAGLFVRSAYRSQGVGKALLHHCQNKHPTLTLKVFKHNPRAIQFYQREGFTIQEESTDPDTNEKEYSMLWRSK